MPFSKILVPLLVSIPLAATTLSELVESGLEHNSIIKQNALQIELMQAKRSESMAKKMGEVDIVGSYTHYNLPRTLAPIVPSALSPTSSVATTEDLFTTGVQYSVPLFTGGVLEEQVKIDAIATKMGESQARLGREELIYNIRSLYLSALSLQELLGAQEAYVEALDQLREKIAFGVEVGKRAKIEEIKADTDLRQAMGNVDKTKSSLRMLKETLMALTHLEQIDHLEQIEVNPVPIDPKIEEASLDELERFKLQDLEIQKGDKMINKVTATAKPQVALSAYWGYNYDLDQIDPFEQEQLWQVGLNAKWDIFDFGGTSARVQQAKIAKLQAITKKSATSEGFKKLFAKAKSEISTALANYESTQSQYQLLQESEQIEQARYDAGVATINDLLLAKSKTELAASQMIQSKYAYQNGIFYLDYLLERGER